MNNNNNNNNNDNIIDQMINETDSFARNIGNYWNDSFFGPRGFWDNGPFTGCHRNRSAAPLPEGIERVDSSHPIPWGRKYDRCLDRGGVSVWDRKGVWNCLIPNNPDSVKALELDSNGPIENKNWFKDYTVYLDWSRAMKRAENARRQRERQEWADQYRDSAIESSNQSSLDDNYAMRSPFDSSKSSLDDGPKLVSESEALKQGKNVISSNTVVELDYKDGEYHRNKVTKKWYDDGTMSITESNNNDKSNGDSKKGWFWK